MKNQQKLSIIGNGRVEMKSVSLNVLPANVLGKILCKLSITERIRHERVSRLWRTTMKEHGWKGQKTLNYELVFDGAQRVNRAEFTNASLVALFKRLRENLIELDFDSFFRKSLPITRYICGSIVVLPNLVKIDIGIIELLEAVPFLPDSLREVHTVGPYTEAALSALAKKCPNLEAIKFDYCYAYDTKIAVSTVNDFLLKYPSLKKLSVNCAFLKGSGSLTSIAELKELEGFSLWGNAIFFFDEETFEKMIENCKSLRRLKIFAPIPVSEEAYKKLATKLPNLVELWLLDHPSITDSVVKSISKCQYLKELWIETCAAITDDTVVYLVKHCKSLVVLHVRYCPLVTEKSLLAVMAEVNRRYGNPPKMLPKGPDDTEIFYFLCEGTGIDLEKALSVTANNPWLTLEVTEELQKRYCF